MTNHWICGSVSGTGQLVKTSPCQTLCAAGALGDTTALQRAHAAGVLFATLPSTCQAQGNTVINACTPTMHRDFCLLYLCAAFPDVMRDILQEVLAL
jgi:molybdopterin-biosynthesis enzyme MoeA-like protein